MNTTETYLKEISNTKFNSSYLANFISYFEYLYAFISYKISSAKSIAKDKEEYGMKVDVKAALFSSFSSSVRAESCYKINCARL